MSSPAAVVPRRALSGRPAGTVAALVDAAVAEVAETGYDGLTIRGVARRARVSPATAYTYLVNAHWRPGITYPALALDDATVAIDWPIPLAEAIISDKDQNNPGLDPSTAIPAKKTLVLGGGGQLGLALADAFPGADTATRAQLDVTDAEAVAAWPWHEYAVVLMQLCAMYKVVPEQIDAAIIASVVPALTDPMADLVRRAFGREPLIVGPGIRTGMAILYENPREVGADRIVNAVAAFEQAKGAVIVVDFGTATTFDCVTPKGDYLGGVIAPGPQLMQQSLLGATVRVRPEQAGVVTTLADNTADAVASGCWGACAALVERFTAQVAPQLGGAPRLLFGGGDAASLRSLVDQPSELFADGVLRGLDVWSRVAVPSAADH